MQDTFKNVDTRKLSIALGLALLIVVAILPIFLDPLSSTLDFGIFALAYIMFALGLNIVVGFAGLLDLGYVAFYAIGAYSIGWFASDHFSKVNGGKGLYIGVRQIIGVSGKPIAGIHLNFLLIILAAMILAALGGALIGLPTLRLRGDYIAIVTLAFGEIIFTIATNGDAVEIAGYKLTEGQQAISPVDQPKLPGFAELDSAFSLRGYFWLGLIMAVLVLLINLALRESRLGRAWIALREDEVAAASMGVPLVRTKLLAYAMGAALGGAAGAFLGSYNNAINSNQFQFSFSILVLSMIILGGLGSVWGVVLGGLALTFIDRKLPDILDPLDIPGKVGLHGVGIADLKIGIFGFLLVIMMVLRPQGLLPERRRRLELTEGIGTDEAMYEARA
ncbi:MAG: branched-chain amino acid transport system permease protein [Thermoleophilaceae bacterium]|nr:branched-chain amino acid transport system permease protein [Thermoleophilaceae bacterium]